jgi:phospholipid/cholesterol/gamma-HCH transport system substrate-binding protein
MAAALYIGFNYLRGLDVFSPEQPYYVKFNSISGLNKGDRVILNGLDVGSVMQRKFSNSAYDEIMVTLYIDRTIVLTEGTVARLSQDLLGTAKIQLIVNRNTDQVLAPNDTLIGEIDEGLTERLTASGLDAADRLSTLVDKIEAVLEPFAESGDTIRMALSNFKTMSENLVTLTAKTEATLEQFDLKMEFVTDSLVHAMGGIKPLMAEYQALGEKLNAVDLESRLLKVDSVLLGTQQLLDSFNSDEGMLGQLKNNDSLYHSLNKAMVDLDSLFMDFRDNPKRYVHFSLFGRKNRPPADRKKRKNR